MDEGLVENFGVVAVGGGSGFMQTVDFGGRDKVRFDVNDFLFGVLHKIISK